MKLLMDFAKQAIDMGLTLVVVLFGFWLVDKEVTFGALGAQAVLLFFVAALLGLIALVVHVLRFALRRAA